ncbi:protein kinase [Planctomycetota bacterium]
MCTEDKNEEAIFNTAVQLKTNAERDAYLSEACKDNKNLRGAVEALLKHHDVDSFLDVPPVDSDVTLDESPISEIPGTLIDRYKLLEKIGEGGMAVVYMAEQEKPIRRKVALKIIKLGMDTKSIIARFEAERQALAMMDHPNIAKVLDAGATETGRPYFVMELVTGVSITEYCDKNNCNTKERLALFIQVCHAVQHAHQKGIIHRDLKPSNILVTIQDNKPVPKVIDFGIAKATNQRLTEKTLFTRYAHIIGTPAYMSPEQADLADLDVDTRSDIYSLGVLLYELLTGTTPFSEEELRKAGYIEMQRVIREQEPPKPSTKLSTIGETLADIAKYRGCTPDLLKKTIRGDLDWIVMKSLEKIRDRRYDNASALAMDIQRHLDYQPILAKAPSTIYRLHKFLQRHRIQAIAALVAFAIVIPLIIMLLIWNQKQRKLDMEVSLRHKIALNQAMKLYKSEDLPTDLVELKSILDSKYVGTDARLLYDGILANARDKVIYYTSQIETNPEDANNYFLRAQFYDLLDVREKALSDMTKYTTIAKRGRSDDFRFGPVQNAGPLINTQAYEYCPGISADNLHMYFLRVDEEGNSFWGTTRKTKDDPWDVPVKLKWEHPTKPVPSWDTADGLECYFSDILREGYGNIDIWVMKRQTIIDDWDSPENLGPTVNSTADEAGEAISADGLELYFSGRRDSYTRPGGYGRADLWMTKRRTRDDPWEEPVNLGPKVNSAAKDFHTTLSADGLLLFFDSDRLGGYGRADIWVIRRSTRTEPWSEPMNLGPSVNSPADEHFAYLTSDGSTLYFESDRPGGYGDHDIWQVSVISLGSNLSKKDQKASVLERNNKSLGKEVLSE